jgi:hypothetical protein
VDLLKAWLVRYKFKNWKETETRKKRVTPKMKKDRAKKIAEKLNNPALWRTHGRGINMDVLREDLDLKINDFRENDELKKALTSYCQLAWDYKIKRSHDIIIHRRRKYSGY